VIRKRANLLLTFLYVDSSRQRTIYIYTSGIGGTVADREISGILARGPGRVFKLPWTKRTESLRFSGRNDRDDFGNRRYRRRRYTVVSGLAIRLQEVDGRTFARPFSTGRAVKMDKNVGQMDAVRNDTAILRTGASLCNATYTNTHTHAIIILARV